jgi:hypothetical protein
MSLCLLAVICTNVAHGDPMTFTPTKIEPDPPTRRPVTPPPNLPSSADLDGLYLWLGPTGAASRIDAEWDSTIGASLTVIRIREGAGLGVIGGTIGASRWTVRDGGRVWIDAIAGTRLGKMVGISAGPLLELAELSHARLGGSVGVWGFLGVTPFVRAGAVTELGGFVELGVHVTLPVTRLAR